MAITRKPCRRCGGIKEPGHRRHLCDSCRALPVERVFRTSCRRCGSRRDGMHPTWCRRCYRLYNLSRRYGLDTDAVDRLERSHTGCAVCGANTKLHVDHDHETGRVRGMLCLRCNSAASLVDADPSWLMHMALYLDIQMSSDIAV